MLLNEDWELLLQCSRCVFSVLGMVRRPFRRWGLAKRNTQSCELLESSKSNIQSVHGLGSGTERLGCFKATRVYVHVSFVQVFWSIIQATTAHKAHARKCRRDGTSEAQLLPVSPSRLLLPTEVKSVAFRVRPTWILCLALLLDLKLIST